MVQGIRAGMSTEPQTVEPDGKLLQSAFCKEAFEKLSAQVAELDATTDEGYEKTKNGIRWCVKARSAVTGLKEQLNKAALAHQRAVNADERKLIALIKTVEDALVAKKKAVDDEVERKRKELEAKHEAWIVGRQDHFYAETGNLLPRALAEELSEPDYEAMVTAGREAKQKAALEAARIAQQEAEEKEAFRQAQAKLAAEKAEFERQQAELKAAQEQLAHEQAKMEAERAERERNLKNSHNKFGYGLSQAERAKIEADNGPMQPMVGTRTVEPMELDYYDDGGQIAHQTVGIPGSVFASRIQSVDAPMSKEDMDQVEAMTKFQADQNGKICVLDNRFPRKNQWPEVEAATIARVDEFIASREESVLASVQESGDVDEDETVRKMIAPIHSEVMVRLVRMQNEAKALEAMFDDFESYLMEFESMAADIRMAVEALQEEMDKYEPK